MKKLHLSFLMLRGRQRRRQQAQELSQQYGVNKTQKRDRRRRQGE